MKLVDKLKANRTTELKAKMKAYEAACDNGDINPATEEGMEKTREYFRIERRVNRRESVRNAVELTCRVTVAGATATWAMIKIAAKAGK